MDGERCLAAGWWSAALLDRLMPLHLVLDAGGRVLSHGPTLGRIFGGAPLRGRAFLDLFALRRPAGLRGPQDFAALAGQMLRLVPRLPGAPVAGEDADWQDATGQDATGHGAGHEDEAGFRLRGHILALPAPPGPAGEAGGDGGDGQAAAWIVNLSFGIDLPRAVAQLQLTDADFAPTDLALELLYLGEANAAVTGELRALAQRLDDARRQAREEAETDPLTGLRNRRACDSMLARLCREGAAFGLLQMDLDFFKAVNDGLGHAAGDHVLMHVANVMKSSSRAGDCLARVGGDEFVMLLPGMTDPTALRHLAERMIALVSQPIAWQDSQCHVSASVGFITVQAGEAADPSDLLAEADMALYSAKNAGRGRVAQAGEPPPPPRAGAAAAAGG
ncbi:MAG: diguanylate cyclase [Paracoccaceae bacterium]